MSDPLKDIDPHEYIEWRRREQKRTETEKFLSNIFGSEQKIMIEENHQIERGKYVLESGDVLYNVHNPFVCKGRPCAIHHPSDHPLSNGPRQWYQNMIWRLCPHNNTHPDFDSIATRIDLTGEVHVEHICCHDNCCGMPEKIRIHG